MSKRGEQDHVHRPAPSFRPNLRLSHIVYPGPERRDYTAAIERIRRQIEEKRR